MILTQHSLKHENNKDHCYNKNFLYQLDTIDQIFIMLAVPCQSNSTPGNWLPISHICLLTNNILFLVMVTMGMWSPCGLMNPILSYVLLSIFDDRINRCTVSNIHIQLKFNIFQWSPTRNENDNIPMSWYSDNFLSSYAGCHVLFQKIAIQ